MVEMFGSEDGGLDNKLAKEYKKKLDEELKTTKQEYKTEEEQQDVEKEEQQILDQERKDSYYGGPKSTFKGSPPQLTPIPPDVAPISSEQAAKERKAIEDAEEKKREEAEKELERERQEEEDKRQKKEFAEQEKLQKEQDDYYGGPKSTFKGSPPRLTPTPPDMPPIGGKEAEDAEKKREEDKEASEEAKADTERTIQMRVEELQAELEEKIEKIKSGPWFKTLLLFVFLGLAVFDFLIGFIPVKGDLISFIVSLVVWFIVCFLLFDLGSFVGILIFLIIDLIAGIVPGIGDFLDLVPEIVGFIFVLTPPQIIIKSFKNRMDTMIAHLRDRYHERILHVRADEEYKLRNRLKRLRGRFSGLAAPNQKMIFIFLFFVMAAIGPLGMNWINFKNGTISFIMLGFIILVLMSAVKFGLMRMQEVIGLILFLGLNFAIIYILQYANFLARYLKSNTPIAIGLFLLFSVLYILRTVDLISYESLGKIMIIVIVLLVLPTIISYALSGNWQGDFSKRQAQIKASIDNGGLKGMTIKWFVEQTMRGKGELANTGSVELTDKFIGVKFEGAKPLQNPTPVNYPVDIDIDYSANAYTPIHLLTFCRVKNIQGTVSPKVVEITSSKNPRISCSFNSLPIGNHVVKIIAIYTYESTTRIPLKLMDRKLSDMLLRISKDQNNDITPKDFVGGSRQAITSAGPIMVAPSNARDNNQDILQVPLILNRDHLNNPLQRIKFQLQDAPGSTQQGSIEQINSITFDSPLGLSLTNCSILPSDQQMPNPIPVDNYRQTQTLDSIPNIMKTYDTIGCQLHFDPHFEYSFLPKKMGWSPQTMLMTMNYDYKITYSVPIEVSS